MRKLITAAILAASLAGVAGAASAQGVVVVERYGHWDPAWGSAPPAPHAGWRRWRGHETGWYNHVHSCSVRYRFYDARRDMYRTGHRWVACRD